MELFLATSFDKYYSENVALTWTTDSLNFGCKKALFYEAQNGPYSSNE